MENEESGQPGDRIASVEWTWLAAIVAVGFALRLWQAWHAPGFFYDEAIYGLDSIDVMRGKNLAIFFDREDHVREPLFMYIQALFLAIGGVSPFTMRVGDAIIGTLTIPVVWLVAREFRGPFFGILGAAAFAVLRWHVHFSGLAFRTILGPLFAALTLLFFFRYIRLRTRREALLCGTFLGLGMYTYLSFRLMPFVLLPAMLVARRRTWVDTGDRSEVSTTTRDFAALFGMAALVFAPLAIHFVRVPWHFTGRSEEVSVWKNPHRWALLAQQTRDVALMPLLRGDHVQMHNIPGPPQFMQLKDAPPARTAELWAAENEGAKLQGREPYDPHGTGVPAVGVIGAFAFYFGLAFLLIDSRRDPRAAALAGLVLVGSLASILSFGAPNMLRLLMITPAFALAIARGFETATLLLRAFEKDDVESPSHSTALRLPELVLIVCLFLTFAQVEVKRLHAWPTHPMVPPRFMPEMAEIGAFLRKQPDRLPVRMPWAPPAPLLFSADGYAFYRADAPLTGKFWELRMLPPYQGMPPLGADVPQARRQQIHLADGTAFAELVEVAR